MSEAVVLPVPAGLIPGIECQMLQLAASLTGLQAMILLDTQAEIITLVAAEYLNNNKHHIAPSGAFVL